MLMMKRKVNISAAVFDQLRDRSYSGRSKEILVIIPSVNRVVHTKAPCRPPSNSHAPGRCNLEMYSLKLIRRLRCVWNIEAVVCAIPSPPATKRFAFARCQPGIARSSLPPQCNVWLCGFSRRRKLRKTTMVKLQRKCINGEAAEWCCLAARCSGLYPLSRTPRGVGYPG
jgi:hypothetical protein